MNIKKKYVTLSIFFVKYSSTLLSTCIYYVRKTIFPILCWRAKNPDKCQKCKIEVKRDICRAYDVFVISM